MGCQCNINIPTNMEVAVKMGKDTGIVESKESLDKQRNRDLKRFLVVFLIWSVWLVLTVIGTRTHSTVLSKSLMIASLIIGLLLLVSSLIFLTRIILLQKQIWSNPDLRGMVDDDIVRLAWLRAAAYGFCFMLVAEIFFTIGMILVTGMSSLRTQAVWSGIHGPVVIAVGIGTAVSAFLFFRRD